MSHNAEPEAVDLLLEVERLDMLEGLCDDKNYGRWVVTRGRGEWHVCGREAAGW
jgi:hypothetical protein